MMNGRIGRGKLNQKPTISWKLVFTKKALTIGSVLIAVMSTPERFYSGWPE